MSTSMNRWILGLSLVSGAAFGATTTVDSWTDPGSATVSGAPGTNSATVDSAGVVGGERDQLVELLNGTGTLALSVAAGAVTISLDDMSSAGTAVLSYDGDDDDAVTLDPTGLGGIDLIDGTEGGLTLPLGTVSGTIDLIVEIHTDGANASEAFAILEACAGPCDPLVIGFERFTTLTGTGADFTNVGAIVFRFTLDDVESVQTNIALTTLAPAIAASNVDSPGTAAPDDDISYTVTIDNTAGGRADAVQFANTLDANVAQQGLIFTSPIAFPDQFETFGGLPLTVSAPGLLSNDVDPDGDDNANAADDVLVDVAPVTTDKGGTVTLNADGSFTYNAPPGFNGIDRFEYTVVDDDPGATNGPRMSSSQVHIKVAGSVIFVDKDAAGGGDGSLATPYNNLTDAQNNSLPSDIIYLFGGSPYTDGITLKNEQQLIGQGVDLRVGTTTLVVGGAATRPVIQTNGIALAQDNLLLGFDLANTTGPAIGGANFGTATIGGAAFANMVPVTDEVGVDSARILDLGTGTLAASFAALSTPAGPGPAAPTVRLTTVAGAATATTTTIAGSGADAIEISGSSATFDFGTTTIDGATLAAIDLSNNTGTFTFNNAMLGVATANGSGLVANGGGTVNFTGTNPTSIADGGPALFVDDSGAGTTVGQTGGAAGFTFTSLQSANAPTDGIVLDSVGSNLSVTGASTVNNATTNGIEISASTGTITFASIDIDGGVTGMLVSGSNVVTVQGGTIDGTTGDGINSVNTGLAVSNVTMGGSTIVGGDGIEVQNTDATSRLATVAGSTLTVSGRGLLTLSNGASTLTLALDTTGIVTTGNALAVDVSSASSGDTIVTSLNGNSVGGAASGGFSFDRVTFDADPGTAGIQTVSGGTTDIGTATNRVVNDGLELLCTTGNLSFADLDVFNTGGDGIEVNTKAGTCGTPTTFTLATTTGVVDTTSGTALNLDPLTTAMTLANVLATPGAGQSGVILDEVDGTVNITSGTITGNTADAFRVVGGTVGGTIGLAIGQLNNASLVSVSGGHATGTLTFQTGVIDASNGDGLQFDNADGSYNFNGTTTLNGGDAGIDITTGSAGTFTFGAGTAITNPTGRPYFESGSTANVTYNGTITQNNPNGLQITNKTGGTTDFNGAITANTSTGIGIDLVNNAGSTIRFDGLLDIDTTNGTGFNASGGGTVAGTGGGTVNSTNETAINFDGVTTDITFTSITSAGGGAPLGIDLTNLGANSTFNGGNTDTRAINIATVGAGADIDFATTAINGRTATGIFVRDVVGGTVDFGATTIPNPGGSAADGIRIRNSGAAVTFASTNISNTVQNITDNFDSVTGRPNTQGNGNGIMLIGNSGSVTINGGTIEDMVDNAVDIRNSDNTTLNGVMIVDGADGNSFSTANSAIMWHQGDNLTLNNVTIRNIGDDSPIPTGGVNVQDSGLKAYEVGGELNIVNSTFDTATGYIFANASTGSVDRAVEVDNDLNRDLNVTVTGSTFRNFDFQGLNLRHIGGSLDAIIGGAGALANSFTNINGAAIDTGPAQQSSTGNAHGLIVDNNVFTSVGIATSVFSARGNGVGTHVFIRNNTVNGTISDAFRLVAAAAGTTTGLAPVFKASVTNNNIQSVANLRNGEGGGNAFFIAPEDGADAEITINGNTVVGGALNPGAPIGGGAINAQSGLTVQNQRSGVLDLVFTGNSFTNFPGVSQSFAMAFIGHDTTAATTTRLRFGGNNWNNLIGFMGFGETISVDFFSGLGAVEGYAGGATDGPALRNYLATLDTGVSAANGGAFTIFSGNVVGNAAVVGAPLPVPLTP